MIGLLKILFCVLLYFKILVMAVLPITGVIMCSKTVRGPN